MFELEFGVFDGFIYKDRKPSNKLVVGNGINDSPFLVAPVISGKMVRHPAYKAWKNMLERSFSLNFKNKQPTYKDVTCCEEWLLFTNFARWFAANYIENYELDKDLLIKGNKIYSPSYCLFIPKEINRFLILNGSTRGELPLGVTLVASKYRARVGSPSKDLGTFNTKEEAHKEWQKAKLKQAIAFNFPPLQRVINQLIFEIENNLETKSL